MKLILIIAFPLLAIHSSDLKAQDIVINEFMSNNENTIQDEDGDYSDWIELYNNGNSPVNLLNFTLSDDGNNLNKWSIPPVVIQPNDHLLIFASGKNRANPANELHTNFNISADGENLYLSSNTAILDTTEEIALEDDKAYCRLPDGGSDWIIPYEPTPNLSNNNNNYLSFSHDPGFYTDPFDLEIYTAIGEDTIYYTLDGSTPTENSLLYQDPVSMDFNFSTPNYYSEIVTTSIDSIFSTPSTIVDKANIVRCASFSNGERTSKIYTHTFFVDSAIHSKYSVPVISLVSDEENLFDPDSGIYVPGNLYHPDDVLPEWTGNYYGRGEEWERPVHIEFFDSEGEMKFFQDAGMRIHGGRTRSKPQKTLRLYARNEYGTKYFNHQLFPQKSFDQYKRFILRTTMGSWHDESIIKDALAHDISRNLNLEYQDFQPALVFINGEFWGIHTIRDRIDERYIAYTHNIDKDSVEFREYFHPHYDALMNFIEDNDLSNEANYEYVKTQMDIDNYIDYQIAEMFFENYDWLPNNIKCWKPKTPGGKWRWVFYDIDAGLAVPDFNMFERATFNDEIQNQTLTNATFLFRNLLKNSNFTTRFINRYAEILNQDFNKVNTRDKLEALKEWYIKEIPDHIVRWGYPDNTKDWEQDLEEKLWNFLKKRPCHVEQNIIAFFDLKEFDFSCFDPPKIQTENRFLIAPNPSKGIFLLYNNSSHAVVGKLEVRNISGQLIYEEEELSLKEHGRRNFQFQKLPTGAYLLNFRGADFNETMKLMIYH